MDTIDWENIDYEKLDKEKSEFIFRDCQLHYQAILTQISKAKRMANIFISGMITIVVAIAGYLLNERQYLDFNDFIIVYLIFFSLIYYIAASVLLSFNVIRISYLYTPYSVPQQYFSENYYSQDLKNIYIGNTRALDIKIAEGKNELKKLSMVNKFLYSIFILTPIISIFLASSFLFIFSC